MNTRRLALVALIVAAGLGLAGCSAAVAGSPAPAASASHGARGNGFGGGQGGQGRFAGGAFPGASGLVAAVSGSTAQVQSPNRQTAVTWTASTTFTNQVSASSSDLQTGQCVVARPAIPSGAGANGGSGGSGGSAPSTVAAATIEVSAPVNGACTAGFAGGRSGTRSGAPTAPPGNGSGNGARNPRNFGGFGAIGTISSVSGSSLVVAEARGGSTQNVTVTWSSSTTFTKLQAGAASDVVVGVCVLAQGKTDDTGALTATTIAVSKAVNGSCTNGFGGRGGPGGPGTPTPGTGTGGKNA